MKRLTLAVVAVISLAVVGCTTHTSSYSVGKNFPSENVSKIVKNETTVNELIQMFGVPFLKTVISENEEKWIYNYSSGTASVQRRFVQIGKVQTTGQHKTLDVLLKNGIVTNFAYTESSEPLSSVQVQ
jgi:hypothetical protein